MLTDLHLQKFLDGQLSAKEMEEMEKIIEKNPELQARLEVLENQSQVIGKKRWQRLAQNRNSRRGSRTRYTTLLPALLLLVIVLLVTRHWFSRPGENSTFTMSGGNGSAMELLYNGEESWRFLDANFNPKDSISISIRDSANYHVIIVAIYGIGPDAQVVTLLPNDSLQTFGKTSAKPAFLLKNSVVPPQQIAVFYNTLPLPALSGPEILDILASHGNERGGLDFKYQVFSSGH